MKLSHLSAEERRAYVLADNKLALNAGWDTEILAIELQALIDIDFDVSLTGFGEGLTVVNLLIEFSKKILEGILDSGSEEQLAQLILENRRFAEQQGWI